MENKKDLSRDFAIIFGIKQEEVPVKSSGSEDKLNKLRERLFQNNTITSEQLIDLLGASEIEFREKLKTCETKENLIKAMSNELKQYSNMENSKLKDASTLEGVCNVYEGYPQTNNAINKTYLEDEYNTSKKENGVKGRPQDMYRVNFKDDRPHIAITENMFKELSEAFNASISIGYQSLSSLLFVSDKETGEMICLDSSSILSITKVK